MEKLPLSCFYRGGIPCPSDHLLKVVQNGSGGGIRSGGPKTRKSVKNDENEVRDTILGFWVLVGPGRVLVGYGAINKEFAHLIGIVPGQWPGGPRGV